MPPPAFPAPLVRFAATYKYQLWLLLVVLIAYIPLSSFQSTLCNDDLDVALPVKYYAGQCFQNGYLPLWNPYQLWGFPAHADLQYTNWNLETLLAGVLSGYDYLTLHVFFLIYLFLGALGAFLLAVYLSKDPKVAFYIACVYVLSGLFVAHAQSLVTILGLVWLPYVMLYYLRWLREGGLRQAILLALFAYLLLTSGYQAFAFMLIPPFAVLLAHQLLLHIKAKEQAAIRRKLFSGALVLVFLAVLLAPLLVSQWQARPFVGRLSGLTVEEVMMNPLSPQSLVSALNPVATVGHDAWFGTELTMRNVFIGLIPLGMLLAALFKPKKNAVELILLSFAALYLLASFGDVLPVRKWLYYGLPGFRLFRFPALLRVVALLLLLCYWAMSFGWLLSFMQQQRRKRSLILSGLLLLSLSLTAACAWKCGHFPLLRNGAQGFHNRMVQADPLEVAFYLGLWQSAVLAFGIFWLNRQPGRYGFLKKIACLSLAELLLVVWIYGQYTAFSELSPKELQSNFSKMQKGFPAPSQDALSDITYKYRYLQYLWRNTGAFKKQLVNGDAWTSFYFRNYNSLNDRCPDLRDSLQSYPFVYLSKPQGGDRYIHLPVDTALSFIRSTFHGHNASAAVQYTRFAPDRISLQVKTQEPLLLNLQQSYYSGWRVLVDGVSRPLVWNAGLLMSVAVPKGLHAVEFRYENPLFVKSLALSYTMLLLLLAACILLAGLPRRPKQVLLLLFLGLSLAVCAAFFRHGPVDAEVKNGLTYNHSTSSLFYDFNTKSQIAEARASIGKRRPNSVRYHWQNYYNAPELLYALGIDPSAIDPQQAASLSGQINYKLRTPTKDALRQVYDSSYAGEGILADTAGVMALYLHAGNPYSLALDFDAASHVGARSLYGLVTLKAPRFSDPVVVCVLKRADGREQTQYFPLNTYLLNTGAWEEIPFYFGMPEPLQAGDKLRLFLMNAKKAPVMVREWNAEGFAR